MRILFLFLMIILIISCNGNPTEKEIYENKLTRERIKIDRVGIGKELREFYEGMNKTMKEVSSDPSLRLLMLRVPVISDDDTLKQCVAYEEKTSISAGGGKVWTFQGKEYDSVPVTYAKIISVEKLKNDYTKVD